jgi:tetratricopeptide (TPR) repeat protein
MSGQPKEALEEMDRFLTVAVDPLKLPLAQLNRASALQSLGRLDEAKAGYTALTRLAKPPYQAYLGLHEIALKQESWGEATVQAQKYLDVAPRNTAEFQVMDRRLDALKSGKMQEEAEAKKKGK